MYIKGNWRRAQRTDTNRNRTKEEIREEVDSQGEEQKTTGIRVTLNMNTS